MPLDPIPPLPDQERRTRYTISPASADPVQVGFDIYGSGTDPTAWVEVYVDGVLFEDWTLSSPSGPLNLIARPITDAIITPDAPWSGTIDILAIERPFRTVQLQDGRPVDPRTFNFAITQLTARQREAYDRSIRSITAPLGETFPPLPGAQVRALTVLGFDENGNPELYTPEQDITRAVRYDIAQDLSDAQELQARANIGFDEALAGYVVGTRAVAVTKTIPAEILAVRTTGYATLGDGGGALYKRVGSEPPHDGKFQDASGAWFELAEEVVNPIMFGCDITGATNAAPAINSAITLQNARGGGVVMLPPGTYSIRTNIILKEKVTLRGSGASSLLRLDANVIAMMAVGSRDTSQGNTLSSNAEAGDRAVTLSAGKGANFAAGDLAIILSEAIYTAANTQKRGEIVRVIDVNSDTVTFHGVLTNSYATSDSAQLQKISTLKDVVIENFAFTNSSPATQQQNMAAFLYCERFVARQIIAYGHSRSIFTPIGCVDGLIEACHGSDLWSPDQGSATYLGYFINEGGANYGLKVIGCGTERARHLYTCDSSSVLPYGLPRGTRVVGCTAKDSRGTGFDHHEEAEDIGFIGCSSDGSDGAGIQIRGRRCFVQGGSIENSRLAAIWLEKDAVDPHISGVNIRNCGLVNDTVNGIDWRENGAIYVDSPGPIVEGCVIRETGGPGISSGPNARNAVIRGNTIINPCKLASANLFGIGSTSTAATTLDIWDNHIRDENSKMAYGVRVSSGNQSAWVKGNRSIGHTIAQQLVSGRVSDNYGQSTIAARDNLTISNGQLNIVNAVARTININGEGGSDDDLNEIIDTGSPDQDEFWGKKGTGSITIKNNSAGPGGGIILTHTGADITMTGSNSHVLFKRITSGVWRVMLSSL